MEKRKKKIKKAFAIVVGFFTIVGAIATIIAIFLNDGDTISNENNYGVINQNSGDAYNIQGENPIIIQGDGSIYYGTSIENNATEEQEQKVIMSEINYIQYLREIVGDNILFYNYNDYDGDGYCEAFALVKDDSYEINDYSNIVRGKIWFVNQNGAKEIESYELLYSISPHFFSAGGKAFIAFETYYGLNGRKTYIWGVKDQTPYQPNISGKGNGFYINKYNEIELCHSTLDLVWDITLDQCTGRTDKNYYFYFDGTTFKEYGGIEIDVENIKSLQNGNDIIDWIYEKSCVIDSIYYRENGIININIHEEFGEGSVRRFHIDLRLDGEKAYLLNDEINSGLSDLNFGLYLKALCPEIATYPEEFPF